MQPAICRLFFQTTFAKDFAMPHRINRTIRQTSSSDKKDSLRYLCYMLSPLWIGLAFIGVASIGDATHLPKFLMRVADTAMILLLFVMTGYAVREVFANGMPFDQIATLLSAIALFTLWVVIVYESKYIAISLFLLASSGVIHKAFADGARPNRIAISVIFFSSFIFLNYMIPDVEGLKELVFITALLSFATSILLYVIGLLCLIRSVFWPVKLIALFSGAFMLMLPFLAVGWIAIVSLELVFLGRHGFH
jgi:membrane protein